MGTTSTKRHDLMFEVATGFLQAVGILRLREDKHINIRQFRQKDGCWVIQIITDFRGDQPPM